MYIFARTLVSKDFGRIYLIPTMLQNSKCILIAVILAQLVIILCVIIIQQYFSNLRVNLLLQETRHYTTNKAKHVRSEEDNSFELQFNKSVKPFPLDMKKNHELILRNSNKYLSGSIRLQPKFQNEPDSTDVERNKNENENNMNPQRLENRIFLCPAAKARLGNWMFRFAAALGVAHKLNYKYVIDSSHPLLKYFEIKQQVITGQVDNVLAIKEPQWRDMEWRKNKTYISYNLTLDGYYQSRKYFADVSSDVRESFEIKSVFRNEAMTFLKNNTPENKTLIGIHVRRGDFVSKVSKGRTVADKSYFLKAMDLYRERYENAFFAVVSNDKKWCKDNIKGNDVAFSEFSLPILDMAIMSLSDHAIITCGTFSWWVGWLCGGTVVYLKDFPRPGSIIEKQMFGGVNTKTREEYYFPEWIGMSNS